MILQLTDKITAIHGDCMEYLSGLESNAFDLAVVDPPYGIGAANMNFGIGKSKKCSKKKNRKWTSKKWDSKRPPPEYFNKLFLVSNNQIIWGGNYFDIPPCYGFLLWDKQIPKGLTFADCEMAWHSFKKVAKLFSYSAYKDKASKIHPTQKPVKLYDWIFHNYAKPTDRILDTHGGSFSSAIAAHYFGCEFVIIEKDKEYFDNGVKRFKQQTKQLKLF